MRSIHSIAACLLAVVGVAFLLLLPVVPIHAAPPALPPRPVVPTPGETTGENKPIGAWIELRVQSTGTVSGPANVWSVVQWQDSAGGWNDIEGWRGSFDENANGVGRKKWWVESTLFGAPNFRWLVYDPASGKPLAQPQPFTLPKVQRQTVAVEVTLAP